MTVTLKELARAAGTSVATVSRALSGSPLVASATRERIRALAEERGYSPNAIARGLVTKHSKLVGLLVPDITNPFFSEWAHAAEEHATEAGYATVLCNTMRSNAREDLHLRTLQELRVAGIVVISLDTDNPNVRRLADGDLPVVFCQPAGFTDRPVDIVTGADRDGARIAVEHLVACGRTRIAHLMGSREVPVTQLRLDGYRDALERAGLTFDPEILESASYAEEGGFDGTNRLLHRRDDVDAIFAGNDLIAVGALQALRALGKRVPEDVAVVGMDDIRLASLLRPALTTVRLGAADIARLAVESLLAAIATPGRPPLTIEIPPALVVRETCGATTTGGPPKESRTDTTPLAHDDRT